MTKDVVFDPEDGLRACRDDFESAGGDVTSMSVSCPVSGESAAFDISDLGEK
jgi:hypothetical protein